VTIHHGKKDANARQNVIDIKEKRGFNRAVNLSRHADQWKEVGQNGKGEIGISNEKTVLRR